MILVVEDSSSSFTGLSPISSSNLSFTGVSNYFSGLAVVEPLFDFPSANGFLGWGFGFGV